jgi:hypothetical protein
MNAKPLKLKTKELKELSNILEIDVEAIAHTIPSFYSIREAMQFIGTDIIRNLCPDWHLNEFEKKIESLNKINLVGVVIGDVRFKSEKMLIEKMNGELFYILNPFNKSISNHESETELSWTNFGSNILTNRLTHTIINDFENKFLKNPELPLKIIDVFTNLKFYKPTLENAFIMGLFINCGEYNNGTLIFSFKKLEEYYSYVLNFFNFNQNFSDILINNEFIIENLKKWNIHNKCFPDILKSQNGDFSICLLKTWICGLITGFNSSTNINCDISIIEKLPKDCYFKLNNPSINNKCLININYDKLNKWFYEEPKIFEKNLNLKINRRFSPF